MVDKWSINLKILEEGHIFFFYKPKKLLKSVTKPDDVGKFYMVLLPDNNLLRFVVLGNKQLPAINDGKQRGWGLINKIGGRGYKVKPQNLQVIKPGGARPAGEGLYAIVKHREHSHLVYALELPLRLGEVQKYLNINRQGNYLMIIKNPFAPAVTSAPFGTDLQTLFPPSFQTYFGHRRYMSVTIPDMLNQEGLVLYFIGVNTDVAKLGLHVDKQKETEETADVFTQLNVHKGRHPIKPLISGKWQ